MELASGLLFLAIFARAGFRLTAELLLYLFMATVILIVSVVDLKKQIIPNKVIYPAIAVGLIAVGAIALVRGDLRYLTDRLIGFASIGVPWAILASAFPRGFGMGDAKLAAFTGTVLDWRSEIVGFVVGMFLGGITAMILVAAGRKSRKSRLPVEPFLALGALVALFWASRLWDLYAGLL